jgi:hypothetical protein
VAANLVEIKSKEKLMHVCSGEIIFLYLLHFVYLAEAGMVMGRGV